MQICLSCARQEHDDKRTQCKDCNGTLWVPQNVGGVAGNSDIDQAAKLIRNGKKPWS